MSPCNDHLYQLQPDGIVALNRGIAVAELLGPEAGLDALSEVELDDYYLYHATKAELLARLGHTGEALAAYDRAIGLTTNEVEHRHLTERRGQINMSKEGQLGAPQLRDASAKGEVPQRGG